MAMTTAEARELRAVVAEALDPIHAADLGNIPHEAATARVRDVLNRIDLALLTVINAGGAQDPARARLDTMTEAVRLLCHDLRGGATALIQTANLIERYAERGDFDRATAKARALVTLVRQRTATIAEGEARALGVGDDSVQGVTPDRPTT